MRTIRILHCTGHTSTEISNRINEGLQKLGDLDDWEFEWHYQHGNNYSVLIVATKIEEERMQ